jgi:hypothetical protein
MCDCVTKVQDLIREQYQDPEASIDIGFTFGGKSLDVKPSGLGFQYRSKKKNGDYDSRKKHGTLVPSFCPFCGKSYNPKGAEG